MITAAFGRKLNLEDGARSGTGAGTGAARAGSESGAGASISSGARGASFGDSLILVDRNKNELLMMSLGGV